MRQKSGLVKEPAEKVVKDIRRATRRQFSARRGTFAGGQHADVQNGRIESLTVGDWTIKNLPIAMIALRQLSKDLDVKRIDGCIGTNLLYHFLATLDYPHGELVLAGKPPKVWSSLRQRHQARASRFLFGLRATTRLAGAGGRRRLSKKPGSSWRKTKLPKGQGEAGS
jgi:hypothetical protein